MADTLRIKRRSSAGAAGAPTSLAAAEIAYNEKDETLYYGWGNSGGVATVVKPIAGPGAFAPLASVVRYDAAQSLTAAQQQQARQNVYAAPFDALAYSGMQINGGMEVSQEKGFGIIGTTANGSFVCDGWRLGKDGTSAVSAIALLVNYISGFATQLSISVQTAVASLAATDLVALFQNIEGWRIVRLAWGTANAQPITIGFWTQHHRPGLYTGTVRNSANNRCYGFTYTHNTADAAQFNAVTIPGDTSGTWATDNTTGMAISFAMASGTTYTAPTANTWGAGGYYGALGQINGIAATSDVFRITGVTLLPGNEAPSAARSPFIMRPYDQELLTCKRYWQKFVNLIIETGALSQSTTFPVEMRADPTVTGGGSGFTTGSLLTTHAQFYQTSRNYQTIVLDARL